MNNDFYNLSNAKCNSMAIQKSRMNTNNSAFTKWKQLSNYIKLFIVSTKLQTLFWFRIINATKICAVCAKYLICPYINAYQKQQNPARRQLISKSTSVCNYFNKYIHSHQDMIFRQKINLTAKRAGPI